MKPPESTLNHCEAPGCPFVIADELVYCTRHRLGRKPAMEWVVLV